MLAMPLLSHSLYTIDTNGVWFFLVYVPQCLPLPSAHHLQHRDDLAKDYRPMNPAAYIRGRFI